MWEKEICSGKVRQRSTWRADEDISSDGRKKKRHNQQDTQEGDCCRRLSERRNGGRGESPKGLSRAPANWRSLCSSTREKRNAEELLSRKDTRPGTLEEAKLTAHAPKLRCPQNKKSGGTRGTPNQSRAVTRSRERKTKIAVRAIIGPYCERPQKVPKVAGRNKKDCGRRQRF